MTIGSRRAAAALVALCLGGTGAARAQVVETTAARPAFGAPAWQLSAGLRTTYLEGAGFDPFSGNDAFVQFSATVTRLVWREGGWSLVAGLAVDLGSSSSSARGVPSRLALTRTSAVGEARFQPLSRLYLFGRLAPGLLHGGASLDDRTSPNGSGLSDSFEALSLDATAGAAFCAGAIGSARVGAWVVADAGYGWAAAQHLVLAPALGGDQAKAGSLDLGDLAPRGGFFRLAVALGF